MLWLGTAERVSAIVEMNHPGVWVMGDLADDDRRRGMGIVVEYAGAKGKPRWIEAEAVQLGLHAFRQGRRRRANAGRNDGITIVKHNAALDGFNQWTINGEAFSMETMKPIYKLQRRPALPTEITQRQRRHPSAASASAQLRTDPRGGKPTSGILKDVVMLGGYQELEVDFVADNPGKTLFHCHQQLHMDFGFMTLFDYA